MTLRTRAEHHRLRRCTDDGASSMVEFAFIMVLLLTIVFGIINFGLILSFKQDVTRAAAEGARAAAVAFPGSTAGTFVEQRVNRHLIHLCRDRKPRGNQRRGDDRFVAWRQRRF